MRRTWWIIGLVWTLGTVTVGAQELQPGPLDGLWGVVIAVVVLLGGGLVVLVVNSGRRNRSKPKPSAPPPPPIMSTKDRAYREQIANRPLNREDLPELSQQLLEAILDGYHDKQTRRLSEDDVLAELRRRYHEAEEKARLRNDAGEWGDLDEDDDAPVRGGSWGDTSGASPDDTGTWGLPQPDTDTDRRKKRKEEAAVDDVLPEQQSPTRSETWGDDFPSGDLEGMIQDGTSPGELEESAEEEEAEDWQEAEEPSEPDPSPEPELPKVKEEDGFIGFEDATPTPTPLPPPNMPPTPDLKTAQFTAYYPREAEVDKKHGLYVYVSAIDDDEIADEVAADVNRFTAELGGEVPAPKTAKQVADLPSGTRITVTPESDELEFEPPSLTKRWRGTWTQFAFDFYPAAAQADETCFVRVGVAVEGIEIAHIKAAIEGVPAEEEPETPKFSFTPQDDLDRNPLLQQKLQAQSITPYQRIFVSYSRRDSAVVRAYKLAQVALGNEVFVDVDNLRSGENWQAALARAIDDADIFQLFWSEHSAGSQYCRYEWEYALAERCDDVMCEGFIRPVFWEKPMPDVPNVLGMLNFKYVPLEGEEATSVQGRGAHTYTYHIGDVRGGNVIIGGEADLHGTQSDYHEGETDDDEA